MKVKVIAVLLVLLASSSAYAGDVIHTGGDVLIGGKGEDVYKSGKDFDIFGGD